MADSTGGITRGIGWLFLIGGALALGCFAIYALVVDAETSLFIKVTVGAIYGGLALLLLSVLRQQLSQRKTDKYKDVEI